MGDGTVLVVDDTQEMREAIATLLRSEGYEVLTAPNGADALVLLRERPGLDCVVLDLEMPVMDGAAFRRAQLSEPELAGVPIVVVSGSANCSSVCSELGVRKCLAKPFSPDALLSAVARSRAGSLDRTLS